MSDQLLGVYQLGFVNVKVFTQDHSNGGDFVSVPTNDMAHMHIGIGHRQNEWGKVVAVVMHEAMEYVTANQLQCRYAQDADFANNSADFFFLMNHQQYAEAVARTAHFMADVIPDISKRFHAQFAEPADSYQI